MTAEHHVFRPPNTTYHIGCSLFDPDKPAIDGEVYVTDEGMIFGTNGCWYRIAVEDIAGLKTQVATRTLSIKTQFYDVNLSATDMAAVSSIRDYLLLCRYYTAT